jgi:hypothetical protein
MITGSVHRERPAGQPLAALVRNWLMPWCTVGTAHAEKPEMVVKVGSGKVRATRKFRALVMLPIVALAAVGLSACDSKAGSAAVVNGNKVSDGDLNSYLSSNPQPIQLSSGSSVPARLFVLRALVNNLIAPRLLHATGGPASASDLAKIKAQLLAQTSEQQLTVEFGKLGLSSSFVQPYLAEQEVFRVLSSRLTSAAELATASKKAALSVSVSPRYGSWDAANLAVLDLSKKQLPGFLTIDGALPGDAAATTGQ